jgi:diaminopropionate ammonia-lyase
LRVSKRSSASPRPNPAAIAGTLRALSPAYTATPLLDLQRLAGRLGVAQLLAKDEGRRMLGSFKSLGGTYAGLAALARACGTDIAGLLARGRALNADLPPLICASDGNHGLAVAAAARFAGGHARIFLHAGVPQLRARRIEDQGAALTWVQGTYDDAVDAAATFARENAGILVADTAPDLSDAIVRDVMAGYGVIAHEVRDQVETAGHARPTHLFVQAGVGGLAAALAEGLAGWMAPPARIVAVEPEQAACLAAAFAQGRVVRIAGALATAAEMLSCGEASAPAFEVLRGVGAEVVTVSEAQLEAAPHLLRENGGPATTPSGATGLAGLRSVVGTPAASRFALTAESRVLLVISEAAL